MVMGLNHVYILRNQNMKYMLNRATHHFIVFVEMDEGQIPASVEVSKEELMEMYETMFSIRRMEITCDTEYKVSKLVLRSTVTQTFLLLHALISYPNFILVIF